MINVSGVTSTPAAAYSPIDGTDADVTSMSPETLLAYCQTQLGDMDTQINDQMSAQKTALREREAVQSVQNTLEQFGTDGPQNAQQMHTCWTAIQNTIAQLPQGDPIAAKLAGFGSTLCTQYHYQPPGTFTQPQQTQPSSDGPLSPLNGLVGTEAHDLASVDAATYPDGVLGRTPDKDKQEWQTTTEAALGNIADDIKSNAEVEMLQLQDLVSQRQQAVQLCTGMMTKADQTLEDEAKAVGQ